MAPVVPRIRTPWLLCLGPPPGPCCPPSPISTPPRTRTVPSPHPTTSSRPTPTAEAAPAVSTARVSCRRGPEVRAQETGEAEGPWARAQLLHPPLAPTGSRSSGSTRSDGGAGRTGRPEDRAPESKSGSGSESEPSTRGGSLRRGGESGGTGDGGPPPSRGSSGGAPNVRGHPGLHPYGPPPGVALPYNPMMVVMVPPPPPPVPPAVQPPGAPPVRDLGSVPPELTASRQSFHMAMGNPSEFFVDVM